MADKREWNTRVSLPGAHGVCDVDVRLTFSIDPSTFSAGMAVIATRELSRAVEQIMAEARKIK